MQAVINNNTHLLQAVYVGANQSVAAKNGIAKKCVRIEIARYFFGVCVRYSFLVWNFGISLLLIDIEIHPLMIGMRKK